MFFKGSNGDGVTVPSCVVSDAVFHILVVSSVYFPSHINSKVPLLLQQPHRGQYFLYVPPW